MKSLQYVNVTADDLLEESNKECCVCLETQQLGQQAYKLPCGHLYHPACLVDWIKRHCTCPCCRYELPTDDVRYEQERKVRMRSRKRRYRLDELKKMKVGQLKEIGRELQIGIGDCLDKDDIIRKYVKSGKIDITEQAPLIELTQTQFNAKGVGELRQLLLSFGLSGEAIEKSELRNRLLESGRVSIILNEKADEKVDEKIDEKIDVKIDEKVDDSRKRSNTYTNEEHSSKSRTCYSIEKLKNTSIHELKQIANLLNISIVGCYDKEEVVMAIINSGKVDIIDNDSGKSDVTSSNNSNSNSHSHNSESILTLSTEILASMSIREIKDLMNNLSINSNLCKERENLIETMRQPQYHNRIRIIN
jgi:hypothetical protein